MAKCRSYGRSDFLAGSEVPEIGSNAVGAIAPTAPTMTSGQGESNPMQSGKVARSDATKRLAEGPDRPNLPVGQPS
jgi:hypothetical protein